MVWIVSAITQAKSRRISLNVKGIFGDNTNGERLLTAFGLDWTLVYPVLLTNKQPPARSTPPNSPPSTGLRSCRAFPAPTSPPATTTGPQGIQLSDRKGHDQAAEQATPAVTGRWHVGQLPAGPVRAGV